MEFTINAKKRKAGNADKVRLAGFIPAVVYGPEINSVSISVDYRQFEKLYDEAGESSLIGCVVEGEKDPITVLIQDVQHDPVKGRILHTDFRQIKMDEEMNATIELRFIGESAAVKGLGGTLIKGLNSVNVFCLPRNLVGHIDVDLSVLNTFDDVIHIKNLVLPNGLVTTDTGETLVAKVMPPLTEDQLKAMEEGEAKSVEEVVVEGEKKEEDTEEEKKEKAGEEKPAKGGSAAGGKDEAGKGK
ncbi:MAG: 50S ribosomal protein L25 [Patescibacteria group bacterium]